MGRVSIRAARVRAVLSEYEPLLIVSLLWFLVQYLRFAFPPLFGTIQTEFGVTNTETGLLFTSLMLAYAVMQFPTGVTSDWIGRSLTITIAAFVFSVTGLAVLFASDFLAVFGLAVLIGAATAAHKTVSINIISNTYPDDTGLCLGVLDTVGQFGGVVAPVVAVAALSTVGWRWTFVVGGVAGIVLAWLNWVRTAKTRAETAVAATAGGTPSDGDQWTYLDVLSDRRLVAFIGVAVAFTFAWNGISAFLPLYLTAEKGLSTSASSLLYSGFFAVSVSQLATGRVSDVTNQLLVVLVLFTVMVASVLSLLLVDGLLAVGVLTLLTGAAFHGFRPVRDSYLMSLIPDAIGGGGLGLVRTGMIVVGAAAPGAVGFVADLAGYTSAFLVIGVALVVGALLVVGIALATRAPARRS